MPMLSTCGGWRYKYESRDRPAFRGTRTAAMMLYRKQEWRGASLTFQKIIDQGGEASARSCAWLARSDLPLYKVPDAESAARKALTLSAIFPPVTPGWWSG